MTDETPFTDAVARLLADGLPTGFADQLRAARAETDRLLADAPVPVSRRAFDRPTLERVAALVAECSACEHIGDGPAAAVVWLPARMTCCLTCVSVAVALPVAPGCHWCGDGSAENVEQQLAVPFGPLVVLGDACPPCAQTFGPRPE